MNSTFNCPVCILTFRDSHDANKHYATKSHISKCLEEHKDLGLVDISSLAIDEEEQYILSHPYYKEQIASADNTRKQLVKEETELLAQLGMFFNYNLNIFGESIGFQYFDPSNTYTAKEIEKLVNDRYPYPNDLDELTEDADIEKENRIDEERYKYRETIEGLKTLTLRQKEDIKNKIENIRSKLQKNHYQNFQPKQIAFYKQNAKRRIIAEYNAYNINIEKKKLIEEKEVQRLKREQDKEVQRLNREQEKEAERLKRDLEKEEKKITKELAKLEFKKKLLELELN